MAKVSWATMEFNVALYSLGAYLVLLFENSSLAHNYVSMDYLCMQEVMHRNLVGQTMGEENADGAKEDHGVENEKSTIIVDDAFEHVSDMIIKAKDLIKQAFFRRKHEQCNF